MRLVFMHGWGFNSSFWNPLLTSLDGYETVVLDAGYFGQPHAYLDDGRPFVAIGHSFGTIRLLDTISSHCLGFVAINGFDYFVRRNAAEGGVPIRVLDRMIARFEEDPLIVLHDFQTRCGAQVDALDENLLNKDTLLRDLYLLRESDVRSAVQNAEIEFALLNGNLDPLIDGARRQSSFTNVMSATSFTHPDGGHLLPITQPQWCAQHIVSLVDKMAMNNL